MRETAGPYKLLERTGEDRLGETFRARDTARGRTAAVRVVHDAVASDHVKRAALIADAGKAAQVSHPAVAALFDVIQDEHGIALAHEHVEGRTLAGTMGGSALNARLAAAIGIQVADGLAELHAHDIVHGAVDGDHVAINPRGQAKLTDAGLVRWLDAARMPRDTSAQADIRDLGTLLKAMTGPLPAAQWADDLRTLIDRTAPGHPRQFEAAATVAAELRAISAMLEARAEAAPPPPSFGSASKSSIVVWLVLGAALLALGAWFLLG